MNFLSNVKSYFGSSPPTPLQKAIDAAIYLDIKNLVPHGASDWSQNLQVCDMIESKYDGDQSATNATKRIQKHLKSKDPSCVLLALTLLETTIKNCSFPTIVSIGSKSFLNTLKEMCNGNKGAEAQQQSLDLVQKLGTAEAYKTTLPVFFNLFSFFKLSILLK